MELYRKIIISTSLISTEIDDDTILLDPDSENYFGFDSIGSDIWRLLKEGKSLQETYNELMNIYEVEPETLKKDLLEFVEKLEKNGLVKVV